MLRKTGRHGKAAEVRGRQPLRLTCLGLQVQAYQAGALLHRKSRGFRLGGENFTLYSVFERKILLFLYSVFEEKILLFLYTVFEEKILLFIPSLRRKFFSFVIPSLSILFLYSDFEEKILLFPYSVYEGKFYSFFIPSLRSKILLFLLIVTSSYAKQ